MGPTVNALAITVGVSNVLCNYFSCDPNVHFTPEIANLTIPLFVASKYDEVPTFFMLTNLLDRFHISSDWPLKWSSKLARYINRFMPELVNHLASEALDLEELFVHWFQYLHSTALPITCLLRLWDSYLSLKVEELPRTVLFVSLALVDRLMPKIIRMEHVEVKSFLSHVPALDMDVLLIRAETLRQQFETFFAAEGPE
jgi:hypothetical protein